MIKARDHQGHEFKSIKEMCKYWNIKYPTFYSRFCTHGDIKRALTQEKQEIGNHKICYDHLGNKFFSVLDMCKYWGITPSLYRLRLRNQKKNNTTLKDILERRPHDYYKRRTDHLGNNFRSLHFMCQHYGISDEIFKYRFYVKKWSLEQSLTTPTNKQRFI